MKVELTVPTFVKGEPGFAAKLNELAAIVDALIKAHNAQAEAPAPAAAKAPARKAPAKSE